MEKNNEMKRMKFYQDGNKVKVKIGGKMYGTDIPLTFILEDGKEIQEELEEEILSKMRNEFFNLHFANLHSHYGLNTSFKPNFEGLPITEEERLTEKEFLKRFKDKGFEMYKVEDVERKLNNNQDIKKGDYVKCWDENGADEFVYFGIYYAYNEKNKQYPHGTTTGDFENAKKISKEEYEKIRNL